ncbi:MAG: peptidase domain-containing ABC transporter [Planctomycetaceae bacterium]
MKVDQLESFLRNCSCFAVLTEQQLEQIAEQAEFRHYKLGEVVFRQGDPGDKMYLVYSGKMRVLREDGNGEIPLNTLFPGDHFGELALVNRAPRSATIRAAADSTLVAVSESAVNDLLAREADIRKYFERYAERLAVWNFVKVVGQIGRDLKPPQLRKLVDQFQELSFEPDQQIVVEGTAPDALYLIHTGRVKAVSDGKVHATLSAGDTFGGGALLDDPPRPSPWTVVADGPVEVLKLGAAEFRQLLKDAPSLRRFFDEQAAYARADEAAGHFREISLASPADQKADEAPAVEPGSTLLESEQSPALLRDEQSAPTTDAVETVASADRIPHAEKPKRRAWPIEFWKRWTFSFIAQHDMMDCGAACVAMITAHHGRPVGVSRLRDLAGVGADGASLAQLAHAASEIGYESRNLRVSADALDRLRLPLVLFWKGYHYVVLYALGGKHAWVADPAFGKTAVTRDELAKNFSGYAMEVWPTEASAEVRPRTRAVKRLLTLVLQNKRTLIGVLITSVVLNLFGLASPLFTQQIVDRVLPPGADPRAGQSLLNLILVGMISVTVFQIVMSVVQGLVLVKLSQRLDRTLLTEFYAHLLTLPTRFFKLRRTGDIVARFADNQHVQRLFTAGPLSAILSLLMVIVYFVVMFYWSVRLSLVMLAFVPLTLGFTLLVSPIMKRQHRRLLEEGAAHESNLIESIGCVDMVKAMAVEQPIRRKWEGLYDQYLKTQMHTARLSQQFGAIGGALQLLNSVALIWYGATLVLRGDLTLGEYMGFSMYSSMVFGPLRGVIGLWDQFQQARVSLDRLSDVLDNEPEPQPDPSLRVYPEVVRGHVRFENVFFNYGSKGSRNVLRGVSFEARPGQRIAIVGRSGSGKSTLARLLLGLYRPTEGRVIIDGWDLTRIDLESYRRQLGFVLQENLLFSGTVRENIALGTEKPDLQSVQEAATLAGAHEFISAMPLGYESVVGELGLTLSGGQRQRINIARALFRKPRILILDEATSALDSFSEREIQKNLEAILSDRTAFIIAHKIATVRDADQILVLHDGAIVEQGTHDELIARRGTYYYLAAQQLNL